MHACTIYILRFFHANLDGTLALQHAIGKGSYGTVHRALWRGTVVAAKVIGLPRCTIEEVRREIDSCK